MFSETLYRLRRKNGLSQEELADAIGVSRQTISKWETGAAMPESEKLLPLARTLHVTVDELLGEEHPPSSTQAPQQVNSSHSVLFGIGILLIALSVLTVLLTLFSMQFRVETNTDGIAASSTITLDGYGVLLSVCIVLLVFGLVLLFKSKKPKS